MADEVTEQKKVTDLITGALQSHSKILRLHWQKGDLKNVKHDIKSIKSILKKTEDLIKDQLYQNL